MNKKTQIKRGKEFRKHYSETKPLKVEARDEDKVERFYGFSASELEDEMQGEVVDELVRKRI